MAKKVQRPAESWQYVLREDAELPPEERSTFTLSPISQAERAAVFDQIVSLSKDADGGQQQISRERRQGIEIAVAHIVSIENFPAGEPVPWPSERQERRQYLEMLKDASVHELANEVWNRSTIGELEKNS